MTTNPDARPFSRASSPPAVALAYALVLLLTLIGLVLDTFTFATNDYGPFLASAIACALTSSALIVVLWSRVPMLGRVELCLCALANLWVLVDGVWRLVR